MSTWYCRKCYGYESDYCSRCDGVVVEKEVHATSATNDNDVIDLVLAPPDNLAVDDVVVDLV